MTLGFTYLWLKIQVWKSGDRTRFFTLDHDSNILRKYQDMAKDGRVQIWPLYLYWASLVSVALIGIALMVSFER